jgi:hypothetical protein
MLGKLLDHALEDGISIPTDLLNDGVHSALCLNSLLAAAMLLAAGAVTLIYNCYSALCLNCTKAAADTSELKWICVD